MTVGTLFIIIVTVIVIYLNIYTIRYLYYDAKYVILAGIGGACITIEAAWIGLLLLDGIDFMIENYWNTVLF